MSNVCHVCGAVPDELAKAQIQFLQSELAKVSLERDGYKSDVEAWRKLTTRVAAEREVLREAGREIIKAAQVNFDWQFAPDFEKAFNDLHKEVSDEIRN